jgi:dCTP deaminase
MAERNGKALFPEADDPEGDPASEHSTGILPSQALRQLIAEHAILAAPDIEESQIQPASLDLRLGDTAWRVRASFLPGRNATVHDKLEQLAMHRIDLTGGAVLEKGCVYIVKLVENVALRRRMTALANPKSSTGRLDVFARVITDHGTEFDRIREAYKGPLYVEIAPRAFSILARTGSSLVQLRIRRGSPVFGDVTLRRLNQQVQLVGGEPLGDYIEDGRVNFTVDVGGSAGNGLIGYRARKHAGLIDVDKEGFYAPADFWEEIPARPGQGIGLDPGDFYILASRERVVVPPDHAAEMMAYDTFVGEFRVHYAGFFDPGFGLAETGGEGSRAVLEVRSHDVPFLVEDGQVVGRLVYERLLARPDKLYGAGIGSSYQRQGLALGKQFKR